VRLVTVLGHEARRLAPGRTTSPARGR
jgi:hypothetical protein